MEDRAGGLVVALGGALEFPVPAERTARYRGHVGRAKLLFGLRPEHFSEFHQHPAASQHAFEMTLDVTEPMGMDTLVFFRINGNDVCARVDPAAGVQPDRALKMLADLSHMHLIDDESGLVL